MAIYIPAGVRRRRMIAIALATLVVGVALGFWFGRTTSRSVDDAVADVRSQASDAAIALQRLPIEYEQAVAGKGGESTKTITDAVGRARVQLDAAFEGASWFGPSADDASRRDIDTIDRAVKAKASLPEFERAVGDAVSTIKTTFGITGELGGE